MIMSDIIEPNTLEILYANNQYCAGCPEMEDCVIITSLINLDKWNDKYPAIEATGDKKVELSAEQQTAVVEARQRVGELFVDLVGVQTECVASKKAGGESLQETAVSVIAGSRVGSLARKERMA